MGWRLGLPGAPSETPPICTGPGDTALADIGPDTAPADIGPDVAPVADAGRPTPCRATCGGTTPGRATIALGRVFDGSGLWRGWLQLLRIVPPGGDRPAGAQRPPDFALLYDHHLWARSPPQFGP